MVLLSLAQNGLFFFEKEKVFLVPPGPNKRNSTLLAHSKKLKNFINQKQLTSNHMVRKERVIEIDVLVEGHGGELIFQPVKVSKGDLKQLIEATKNPVIKENLKREAEEKKVKL